MKWKHWTMFRVALHIQTRTLFSTSALFDSSTPRPRESNLCHNHCPTAVKTLHFSPTQHPIASVPSAADPCSINLTRQSWPSRTQLSPTCHAHVLLPNYGRPVTDQSNPSERPSSVSKHQSPTRRNCHPDHLSTTHPSSSDPDH